MDKIKVKNNQTGEVMEFDSFYNAIAYQEKCVFVYRWDVEILNSRKVR